MEPSGSDSSLDGQMIHIHRYNYRWRIMAELGWLGWVKPGPSISPIFTIELPSGRSVNAESLTNTKEFKLLFLSLILEIKLYIIIR
jgi:hypothetical protein